MFVICIFLLQSGVIKTMAMMAKMRSLAPAFIITVGALFVLFMVISDSNVLEALGGRSNDVGSINGVNISYREYQFVLDQQRETQKQQTGEDIPDDQWDQFREQVWETLVTQKLLEQEIERLGVTVSDEEIKDIILGDNPPEFLKQNFIDSTGTFNRQLYEQALFDPQNTEILIQVEEQVRQQRLTEKLQSLLLASVTVNEDEILRKFKEQNIFATANYAAFPVSMISDSAVVVTEEDMKNYYEENLDRYKINAQRKFRFVLFINQPSAADTSLVLRNLENVKEIVTTDTSDFKSFVEIYSAQPYSLDTVGISAFSTTAIEQIKDANNGDIIGPVQSPGGFALYRLIDVIPSSDKMVRASHILISKKENEQANLDEANRIYDELINGADFNLLAAENSGDPGSAARGGDLGWFGKGAMVKEFDEACFSGNLNEIQKPLKTNFGYHIIKVTGQSDSKYVIEQIVNPVTQSAATRDENYNAASDFSYLAEKNGFDKEAELLGHTISETPPFQENSPSISGLGVNKRLVKFAFENSVNTVSEVFKVQQGFVVVQISESIPEGFREYKEVEMQLKQLAGTQKKFEEAERLAGELSEKTGGDLGKITALDPRILVNNTGRFNYQTSIPNIGKDYGFIDAAFSLEKNQLSEPVRGVKGFYLIHLIEKTKLDSAAYNLQSGTLRNNLLQAKKNAFVNQWLTTLKEKSDIVDNRYMFYAY
ncbi:MAG: hypothetical protein DRQ13_00505 [Ignavibacteriae bacterium]|nr:MAG: hypothetical protein DRQ13_00505 [Ignavibacteriota bacterium]